MRRAERKLQLSYNVVGEDNLDNEGKDIAGTEAGDLRSAIFGLRMFDPTEMSTKELGLVNKSGLIALAEKITAIRHEPQSDIYDKKFEINHVDVLGGCDLVMKEDSESVNFDPGLDEAAYLSWVEKFKQASLSNESTMLDLGNRRGIPDDKHLKAEAAKKKAEEKKLSKWEAHGYHSLSICCPMHPLVPTDQDFSDSSSVNFVYGDCTQPSGVCPSEPTIIFRSYSPQKNSHLLMLIAPRTALIIASCTFVMLLKYCFIIILIIFTCSLLGVKYV